VQTIGCKLGTPTPVTLKAGESVLLEALDPVTVGQDSGIDFGLYAVGGTLEAENGVTLEAADFTATRVFTMGAPSAVAHLFTRESQVIITAGDHDLGSFHVVVKAVSRFFARIARGQHVTPQ
jgi:hypothetical protein